jgi:hypothetical protein
MKLFINLSESFTAVVDYFSIDQDTGWQFRHGRSEPRWRFF